MTSIRYARPDEVEVVVRLHHVIRETCMPYLPVLHTIEEGIEYFSKVVFRDCSILVAEHEGVVIGYCAFQDGWLNHLYVHPNYQHQGVGSALLAHAMHAKDTLQLWVFQRNVDAIRLYESAGFRLVRLTNGGGNEEREPDALYSWSKPLASQSEGLRNA